MSSGVGDRLVITEDSDDEEKEETSYYEEEPLAIDMTEDVNSTVAFPTEQRKKKKIVKKLTKKEQSLKRSLKEYRFKIGLVKPDVTTNRELERELRRIATKGVVQLFNAVADRQKTMSDAVKTKMTVTQRKQAREKFDGKNFNVDKFEDYGFDVKDEFKNENAEDMNIQENEIDQTNYSDED